MAGINYKRVALGGLAAGVVANICDFVTNGFLMAEDMRRMAARLNLDLQVINSPAVAMTWVVIDFIYMGLIVWTYAAIRPRLGPGPSTAIIAGLVLYAGVTAILFGFHAMGIFTPDLFIKNAAFSLVTTIAASYVGGYVYKEDD